MQGTRAFRIPGSGPGCLAGPGQCRLGPPGPIFGSQLCAATAGVCVCARYTCFGAAQRLGRDVTKEGTGPFGGLRQSRLALWVTEVRFSLAEQTCTAARADPSIPFGDRHCRATGEKFGPTGRPGETLLKTWTLSRIDAAPSALRRRVGLAESQRRLWPTLANSRIGAIWTTMVESAATACGATRSFKSRCPVAGANGVQHVVAEAAGPLRLGLWQWRRFGAPNPLLRQLGLPLRGVWALTSLELPWAVPDGPT
jgi:hypothetical protein